MPNETPPTSAPVKKSQGSGWLNVLVDYGPLLVFLGVYLWSKPDGENLAGQIAATIKGTAAFMVAAIIALAVSKWRLGKVSPMLWLSTGLIIVFGGITIYSGDQRWIQAKPTVVYVVFGAALLIGWWMGRAVLKILLEAAFEGLSDEGWLVLSRNWGLFFLFLAVLNESIVAFASFESWLWAKFWVFMPLTFLFTFSQVPMLLRNGLGAEGLEEEEQNPPPVG
ncbi:inner membrane-spanning protein YciB [Allopontixanthobacter sediminis]|uniref:Inner membrane-spanning protein YciB n=1 Tax=Allopontixanthobacter sediminis TaxID=1689985 RepID=A0A845B173_9SPHN|nr:inner membrane-spanning protein YciB [Allopontixanthobacter sediminis]MXP43926.1 intracellular septation protein A [Allopontixanthobacter sediminis]